VPYQDGAVILGPQLAGRRRMRRQQFPSELRLPQVHGPELGGNGEIRACPDGMGRGKVLFGRAPQDLLGQYSKV
jgi:hypothetical protein